MILVLFLIGVFTFFYYVLVRPFKYWDRKKVPQYSFWNVWLQNILALVQYRSISDEFKKLYNDFSGLRYSGIYQFFKPNLSIRDPDLIKTICVKDSDYFTDHFNFFPSTDDDLWGKNLVFLKGDLWKEMRNTLSPSFTSSKMKLMFGLINDCALQFVKFYEEDKNNILHLEMKDTFTRFANDVIATSAFGVTCDSLRNPNNEFYLMGKKVTNFAAGTLDVIKFILSQTFPRLSKKLGITAIEKKLGMYFKNVITSNIKAREANGIIRPDMIHLLMEARKGKSNFENLNAIPKSNLTNDDIAAQAFIFFLAGFDSVATLMYFLAYELAVNPDVQLKLQAEINDILGDLEGDLTYEKLSKMKYMDMVISETSRKWPNAIALDRECVKPYTIQPVRRGESPVQLKEGDVITISIFGLHRDPEYFPDPERFDPERFSDENKSNINPYAYLPFGVGPRACIGNRFALMETKLVFFHLLSKFDIIVTEKTPIPLKLSKGRFQLDTDDGFWMGLRLKKP